MNDLPTEMYKDVSPFRGVREFLTPEGVMRFGRNGAFVVVFRLQQGGFVSIGSFRGRLRMPKQLYQDWVESRADADEECEEES